MISKNQAFKNIANIVYETLFNLSRDEMLAIAKKHPHFGMGAGIAYAIGDEDESLRDCLSEKALAMLSDVDGELAKRYTHFKLVSAQSLESVLESFSRDIRHTCEKMKAKHGDFPIWYEVEP
jgi:hypothetical protein